MLLRQDQEGVLAIGQPSHAFVSGQLARAWGNERFGSVEPYEEVCLAAEQHDIGMAAWDLAPSWNPATGLPHSFIEMPISVHLGLWSDAPRRLLRQSRYAALLVSMHGARLYRMRDLERLPSAEAAAVRRYFDAQQTFQQELVSTLRADPSTAADSTPELIARNSDLIWTWDYLSLGLCLNWHRCTARDAPSAAGPLDVALTHSAQPGRVKIAPWPFSEGVVSVRFEGQRLSGRHDGEAELREALAQAPWETIELELVG